MINFPTNLTNNQRQIIEKISDVQIRIRKPPSHSPFASSKKQREESPRCYHLLFLEQNKVSLSIFKDRHLSSFSSFTNLISDVEFQSI